MPETHRKHTPSSSPKDRPQSPARPQWRLLPGASAGGLGARPTARPQEIARNAPPASARDRPQATARKGQTPTATRQKTPLRTISGAVILLTMMGFKFPAGADLTSKEAQALTSGLRPRKGDPLVTLVAGMVEGRTWIRAEEIIGKITGVEPTSMRGLEGAQTQLRRALCELGWEQAQQWSARAPGERKKPTFGFAPAKPIEPSYAKPWPRDNPPDWVRSRRPSPAASA